MLNETCLVVSPPFLIDIRITRFEDAISSLEDVQSFLDYKGFSDEATKIASSSERTDLLPLPKSHLSQTDDA